MKETKTMNARPLSVVGVDIAQDDHGRYSLNDLHRAAGGEKRHQPSDPDEATSPGVQPGVERSSRNGLLLFDVLTQDFDWRSTTRRGEVGRGPQNAPALQPRMEVPEFLAQQAR